jgi:hypothetical protein
MRLVKTIIFLLLLVTLIGLLVYIQDWDEESVPVTMHDQLSLVEQSDLNQRTAETDSLGMDRPAPLSAFFEDYEANVESKAIIFKKSNQMLGKYQLNQLTIQQVILADLNEDDVPECWILALKPSKRAEIFALTIQAGQINRINFPTLKGRQAFGYIGKDSLYLDKSTLARQFEYANDIYSEIESGRRVCYYQFGKDQSFVLKKTLDL